MKDISEVVIGGLYKAESAHVSGARNPSHEQSNGLFIACSEEPTGKIWMLDTYKLKSNTFASSQDFPFTDLGRSQRFIDGVGESGAKVSQWTVRQAIYDGYYSSTAELTPYNVRCFEFLGYLPDYRAVSEREAANYADEDLLHRVKLWREHAYPKGIELVRKDAKTDSRRILDAFIADLREQMNPPSIYFDFATIEKAAENVPGCELEIETLRREYDAMEEMTERWRDVNRAMRKIREAKDPSALEAWDAGVPTDDIFA